MQKPLTWQQGWKRAVWPDVTTIEGAIWATKQAFWAAVIVAAITIGFATLAAVGVRFVQTLGIDVWAFVDGIIFVAVAVGLWKHSRTAAWIGFIFYAIERLYMWSTIGVKNPVMAALFLMAFIGGIRGTSALRRHKKAKADNPEQQVTAASATTSGS